MSDDFLDSQDFFHFDGLFDVSAEGASVLAEIV